MDNLLKILPLMNLPEAIRQPLLLDALAGKGNAMVGFIAAREASDAAQKVIAEKENGVRVDRQKIKDDAEVIMAHLYRRAGSSDAEWAAWLAALRSAIEAESGDDDQTHLDAASDGADDAMTGFLVQLISGDETIAAAVRNDFDSILQGLGSAVKGLERRQKRASADKDRRRRALAALPGRKSSGGKAPDAGVVTRRER